MKKFTNLLRLTASVWLSLLFLTSFAQNYQSTSSRAHEQLHMQQSSAKFQSPVPEMVSEHILSGYIQESTRSVLWSQIDNSTSGRNSQQYETALTAYDNQAADDFIVTDGPWDIGVVKVLGFFSAGGPAIGFNVFFYENDSGEPGNEITSFTELPYSQSGDEFTIVLPSAVMLNNGHYWLSVQARMNFTPNGQWYWLQHNAPTIENEFHWRNPGDGFGSGFINWTSATTIGSIDKDLCFILEEPLDCAPPTGLTASNITSSSADLSWNPGGSETLWNVEVGLPGFTPGTGQEVIMIYGYDKQSWTAEPLDEGTAYQFYVQADCASIDLSEWSGPVAFTTYCEFECPVGGIAETEACGDTINNGCNLVINQLFESINPGDIICGTVWAEGGTRDTDWFELILTEPSEVILHAFAEAPVLFGLLNYGSGTPGNPVCPATAFIENEITALCSPTTLNLGVLVAGTHWIFAGLPVFNGYPCDINYWIEFEVIEVECAPPTNLTATNITTTSADLGWTAGGIETMWNVEVGEPGFVPGTAAEILSITGTTDNPWTASPLASATEYEFYVQADCGGVTRSLSDWAGPFSFVTECLPFGLPLAENFDAATPDEVPICWDRESNTVPWRVTSGISPYSEPHSMATFYNSTLPKDDWFFSPALELTGGVSYYVQFYLRAPGWDGTGEKLAVKWGDAPAASAMTAGTIYTNTDIQYADWTWVGGSFTPATTGLYYIGWHAFSDEDLDYIAVDDIQIDLSHPVTFNVDITTIDGFNHDTEVIYLAGSFPGAVWNQPGTNPDLLMERVGLTDVYTITLDLPVGWFEYKYFRNTTWDFGEWPGGPNRTLAVDDVTETFDVFGGVIEWANLQAPENGNIPEGGDMQVWGQVYIPNGITEAPGATFGLEAWVGVHNENTDPAGWTSWVPATFNVQQFSNDEFHTLIGEDLVPGTYYYAFRYRFGQIFGEYVYGGYNSGFWDGITNVSGVLTVTPAGPPPYILVDGAVDDCVDATDEVEIVGATVENGAIADIRSGGIITATDFEVKSGGTAYLTAATSITLGNEVLITPGATGLFLAQIGTFDPCILPLALVASVEEFIPVLHDTESFFKVFPNPTTSTFKLELLGADEAAKINVEIYGMMGERVFQDVLFGGSQYEFDLSNMPKGIYFIRVLMGDEMGIEKVIKQ